MYRVSIGSTEIVCDTADEVRNLLRVPTSSLSPKAYRSTTTAAPENSAGTRALGFLHFLAKSKGPVTSKVVAKAIGLKKARGMAGTALGLWGKLKGSGLKREEVAEHTHQGKLYYWGPGPKIDEAIKYLNEQAG